MGWQPATHRLAHSGGVSGPWRGAWNTPCRKHHVIMTPQKSPAAGKQRAAQRLPGVGGLARRARLPLVPCCTPIPLDRSLGNLESGVTGRLGGCPDGSQGLGICKGKAGGGAGHVACGSEHSRLPSSSPSGRLPFQSCNRWEDNCPCTISDLRLGGLSEGLPCVRGASCAAL